MAGPAVDAVYRAEFGRALATVARLVGDIAAAEDAVQEAFAEALRTWPARGTPANPGAWITTVARNRALDRLRREATRADREVEAARVRPPDEPQEVTPVPDDQLRMIFTCCHPALSSESQVALTLRLVCGLRTSEIARAFLQPEHTVAQRLSRAKAKIRRAAIPLRVPPRHLLPERLPGVLACVYLVFTEGYSATGGPAAVRAELCDEAIRLGRLLCALLPAEPEARALLALMLLHDSRRGQRRSPDGAAVPLEEQDRGGWNRAAIAEGRALLADLADARGPYLAQARIAAAHASARTGPRPTGRGWWRATTNCCGTPRPRWCGSTARSPSVSWPGSTPGWPRSTRSPGIPGSRPRTWSPRAAPTCCAGPDGHGRPPSSTGSRSTARATTRPARSWPAGYGRCRPRSAAGDAAVVQRHQESSGDTGTVRLCRVAV